MMSNSTKLPLEGLRVLVTRPRHQAQHFVDMLQRVGAEACTVPLLEIQPLSKVIMPTLGDYDIALFVSQNAVVNCLSVMSAHAVSWPSNVVTFGVGEATTRALQTAGIQAIGAGAAMNSEALLAQPSLKQVSGKRVLICRGRGGRTLLGDTLLCRGAEVDYLELYERLLPAEASAGLKDIHWGRPGDVATVYSGETLANLVALCHAESNLQAISTLANITKRPILTPGKRVADQAREANFNQIIIADSAADQTMLAALLNWRKTQTGV